MRLSRVSRGFHDYGLIWVITAVCPYETRSLTGSSRTTWRTRTRQRRQLSIEHDVPSMELITQRHGRSSSHVPR
jgi:hypothetical protein